MSVTLGELLVKLDGLWPATNAEDWDVVGLVVGNSQQQITKILMTVDVTNDVVNQAIEIGANLIIAHHPFLLTPINSLQEQSAKGRLLSRLIRSDIALYTVHTNADVVPTGTSQVLANAIGLVNSRPLIETGATTLGIGSIGTLPIPMSLGQLAGLLNSVLPPTASGVRVAGDFDRTVFTVALCAGAGDSYLQAALAAEADVYITSDLRHHPAQDILELAAAQGKQFSLMDISHWAAEYLWLSVAKAEISNSRPELHIELCDLRTDVFDFLMNSPQDS